MPYHSKFEALAAGYVLMTLDAEEHSAFEDHLSGCAECARLVAELKGVVHSLPLLVDEQDPPAALKARILAAAGGEGARVRSAVVVVEAPAPARWRLSAWRAALAAGAALLLLTVAGLAVWTSRLQDTVSRNELYQAKTVQAISIMGQAEHWWPIQRTAAAPDATGSLAYAEKQEAACLVIWGLPHAEDKTYQVWIMKEGVATAARPLRTMDTGMWIVIPGALDQMDTITISLEPPGIPDRPHGTIMATVSLVP